MHKRQECVRVRNAFSLWKQFKFLRYSVFYLLSSKLKCTYAVQKTSVLVNSLTAIISSHMKVGDSFCVTTPSLTIKIQKSAASNINTNMIFDNTNASLPSFCHLTKQTVNLTNSQTVSSILDLKYDPSVKSNCINKVVTFVVNFIFIQYFK